MRGRLRGAQWRFTSLLEVSVFSVAVIAVVVAAVLAVWFLLSRADRVADGGDPAGQEELPDGDASTSASSGGQR